MLLHHRKKIRVTALMLLSIGSLSCGDAPPHRVYIQTLQHIQENPQAWKQCRQIADEALQQDCIFSAVPHIATQDTARAEAICDTLSAGRAECFFLLAESTLHADYCTKAGSFTLDCRLHILSKGLQKGEDPPQILSRIGLHLCTSAPRHLDTSTPLPLYTSSPL